MTSHTTAKVLLDSTNPTTGTRLTTFEVCFPRFILAEVNTHRMLSRNFQSSRAVPVERRIMAVDENPFVPAVFGRNKRGMQAGEGLTGPEAMAAEFEWRKSAAHAVAGARQLAKLGVHKQLANRLLEPFSYVLGVITATEWANFYALRTHKHAQPEFRELACLMADAHEASTPEPRRIHAPYLTPLELATVHTGAFDNDPLAYASAGRCCRVSYFGFDGSSSIEADEALARRLVADGHMSPLEHVAAASVDPGGVDFGNFLDWIQLRKCIPGESVFRPPPEVV